MSDTSTDLEHFIPLQKKENNVGLIRVTSMLPSQRILKVTVYTPICKPLNGTLPRSNKSHLLRLAPITYSYKDRKKTEEAQSQLYFIKGLRGAVRHASMAVCFDKGLEVCHSSDKKEDKNKNPLIPAGFHPLGACVANGGSCLLHQIYGGKGQKSIIKVTTTPISSAKYKHKTATFAVPVQDIFIKDEHRVSIGFDGRAIQDFGEKYFSGTFNFEIDVTQCNEVQLGLLVQSILRLEQLGRGSNAGYGMLDVQEFELVERVITKRTKRVDNRYKVIKEVSEEPLYQEVEAALEVFKRYVSRS